MWKMMVDPDRPRTKI